MFPGFKTVQQEVTLMSYKGIFFAQDTVGTDKSTTSIDEQLNNCGQWLVGKLPLHIFLEDMLQAIKASFIGAACIKISPVSPLL